MAFLDFFPWFRKPKVDLVEKAVNEKDIIMRLVFAVNAFDNVDLSRYNVRTALSVRMNSYAESVDELERWLSQAAHTMKTANYVPETWKVMKFKKRQSMLDDFLTKDEMDVPIEEVMTMFKGYLKTIATEMERRRATEDDSFAYFCRQYRPIIEDSITVLKAIHQTCL